MLRQAAHGPVHTLAAQSRAMASLRIFHEGRLRFVCAATLRGRAFISDPADPESIARTATGRVPYAARRSGDGAPPDCWTPREWRQLHRSIREPGVTVADRQDAVPGICCVSAPVWRPNGACAGAVTLLVRSDTLPSHLPDMVSHTASRIGAALRRP